MADSTIKKIDKNANTARIIEYLDYLSDTLSYILDNLDEENLSEEIMKKIER